jgi:lambda repressor-like predicted transcriptional regulator
MNKDALLTLLRNRIDAAGSLREFARQHGFSPSYAHQVLHGRAPPGPRILAALGLKLDYRKDRADG